MTTENNTASVNVWLWQWRLSCTVFTHLTRGCSSGHYSPLDPHGIFVHISSQYINIFTYCTANDNHNYNLIQLNENNRHTCWLKPGEVVAVFHQVRTFRCVHHPNVKASQQLTVNLIHLSQYLALPQLGETVEKIKKHNSAYSTKTILMQLDYKLIY